MRLFKKLILAVIILMAAAITLNAQVLPNQEVGADSVSRAILPVFGYSSDIGFLFGGIYSRYDYTGNTEPFNNLRQFKALVSTRGYVNAEGVYEKTNSFGTNIRMMAKAYVFRFSKDSFFGIGNNTQFSSQLFNNDFYFFESISFGLEYRLRKAIYEQGKSQFDLAGGLGFNYQIPHVNQPNSTFSQILPNGTKGGFVNYITGGVIWENRDSEFDPQTGNRAELEIRYAPKYLSEYALTTVRLDLRQYVHLFNFVTVAGRLEGRHAGGNVPYWELSTLGDDFSLRGYPLNRFQGNSSIAYNLELRSWLIRFPRYGVKLGGHLFTDGGRVFTGQDDVADLFENYKQTVGFGGAFSAFSPDFILRGEIGFSEDVSRIYIGIGYLF